MIRKRFGGLGAAAAASLLLALPANRPPPDWQGLSNASANGTARCVQKIAGRFAEVRRHDGRKPEQGSIQLLLFDGARSAGRPVITVDLDGGPRFSSIMMDATDHRLGRKIWLALRRHCGVS
jgi:hypothetical protein